MPPMADNEHVDQSRPDKDDREESDGGQKANSPQGGEKTADGGKDTRPDEGHGEKKRSYKFLWIFGAVAIVAVVGILLYHFLVGQYHVTTTDAYVNGNMIRLQPQVTGTV